MLAAKASLAIRYDALGEDTNAELGVETRAKLEARLRILEERGVGTSCSCDFCILVDDVILLPDVSMRAISITTSSETRGYIYYSCRM